MLHCALIKKCGRLVNRTVGDLFKVDVFTFWLSLLTVLSQVWLNPLPMRVPCSDNTGQAQWLLL
jgi:hypothetical protein